MVRRGAVEERLYQETIVGSAVNSNTLVVAPTAMGKTVVAALVAAHRLHKVQGSKILMLSTTRPLASQHAQSFTTFLEVNEEEVVVFTGTKSPKERAEDWNEARVICATPQVVHNDLLSHNYSLEDVSLLVFDEAHRARGNFPYPFIASQYVGQAREPLILALTASPGGEESRIREVVDNLYIENIEIRTEEDPDVKPFLKGVKIEWVNVEPPEGIGPIKSSLDKALMKRLKKLRKLGFSVNKKTTKKELLMIRGSLQSRLLEEKAPEIYEGLSLIAGCINLAHAQELLETQGLKTLLSYFRRMEKEGSTKAVKGLLRDSHFLRAVRLTENLADDIGNPKLEKIKEILAKYREGKAIIFTQYRDTASQIVRAISSSGLKAERFVGHAKKGEGDSGLSQKKQLEVLERFREGEIDVLVATSVAEEGLDIPRVDVVIFYEPIPSEIRSIQRRGRTGRRKLGRAIVLISKNTRDEAYYWASRRKENKMREVLEGLKKDKLGKRKVQRELNSSRKEGKYTVAVDTRELSSGTTRELLQHGVISRPKRLEVGDYIVSDRLAIERKTTADFVDSLIDGRLLGQALELRKSYPRGLMVVEGENLYGQRNIRPEAVMGALISLAVDFNFPVFFTENEKETATLIARITAREQEIGEREVQIRGDKKVATIEQKQELLVAGLPYVNTILARRLLERFGSVGKVFTASIEDLTGVQGIGEKIAKEIREVIEADYAP